jgi:hypothetical protein
MPKMTDRERLAKIETDQRLLADEADTVRRSLRAHYGQLVADLPVERLTERDFRDLLLQAVRVGGGTAVHALKGLPGSPDVPLEQALGGDQLAPVRRRSKAVERADDGRKAVHP